VAIFSRRHYDGIDMTTSARRRTWVAATIFIFTWSLTTHGKYSVSGDEPHYLMITHSLLVDGDLDVANNYDSNDGRFFGHAGLDRGRHARPSRDGRVLPVHDIGLSVVLVPVYAIAQQVASRTSEALLARFRMTRGLFAYSIVGLFLISLTTAGMIVLSIGLGTIAGDRTSALLVLIAAVSPPIVSHAFLVFPEVLALFVTSVVVWWALNQDTRWDTRAMLLIAVLLGVLPWAHHKFLLYCPGLAFLMLWMRWPWVRSQGRGVLIAASALVVVPQIGLHLWTLNAWGTLGGAQATEGMPFSVALFEAGMPGLWIDRQSGLLAYAPIYWVLPACVLLTWRKSWPLLVPVALLYLPAAAFVEWWAGFAPAARYLVPAIPLLLVPFSHALEYVTVRRLALALCVPQLIIDAMVWQRPRLLWPPAEGNPVLRLLGAPGRAYEWMLPPLQHEGLTAFAVFVVALWLTCSVALVVRVRREPPLRIA
jgi:hypothetical protein